LISAAIAGTDYVATNDSRLSDARTPTAHDHVVSDITPISGQHLIGRHANGSGDAQEVTVSGGIEFSGSGIQIANTAVTAGSYTAATITVDGKGRITAASGNSFAPLVHTHVSADITDATSNATPSKIVLRGVNGEALFGDSGNGFAGDGVYAASDSGKGINAVSGSGTAAYAQSTSGSGGQFISNTGIGLLGFSNNDVGSRSISTGGTNHAEFGNNGDDRSFIRRVLGLFGWHRGSFVQAFGSPASLSADRTVTLPDRDGTVAMVDAETHTGAHAFTSTTRPTSAGTGTPASNSLVTRSDIDARFMTYLPAIYEWTKAVSDYTATNVSTGASSTATNVLQLGSGATAGGSALLRSDVNEFRAWHRSAVGRQAVDWTKTTIHHVRISSDGFTGADTVFRIHLGLPSSLTTVQNLQTTDKAIGFNVVAGEIFATVADGSAVTTTTTGVTMSAWVVYDCTIRSNGDGTWTATVNSTTVSGTGAPSTLGSASAAALVMSATNGTTASSRRFFINNQKTMQF
jgi:hypothetical protein